LSVEIKVSKSECCTRSGQFRVKGRLERRSIGVRSASDLDGTVEVDAIGRRLTVLPRCSETGVRANNRRSNARIIRWHALSAHAGSVVDITIIAAAHQVCAQFSRRAAAFGFTASVSGSGVIEIAI